MTLSQTANETYTRGLFPKGHGYPLWDPEPDDNLWTHLREYWDKGVSIGDVGIITPHGTFDYLFNICLPADDPVNLGRTPPDFLPITLSPLDIRERARHHPNKSFLSSCFMETKRLESDVSVGSPYALFLFLLLCSINIVFQTCSCRTRRWRELQ
jgi:hypothetical protein